MKAVVSSYWPWPLGFIVLLVAGVPALSGYPLALLPQEIVSGISMGWTVYGAILHLLIPMVLGRRWYANILAATAVITLPVVYGGAAISWLGMTLGIVAGDGWQAGVHYTQLCLRMLTVVPLALALGAVLPLDRIERRLLQRTQGITNKQKKLLMAIRVFNHTAFFVLPTILEILREERPLARHGPWSRPWSGRILRAGAIFHLTIHLAAESIGAAVQYIPLWAYEIAQLPEPPSRRKHYTQKHRNPPKNTATQWIVEVEKGAVFGYLTSIIDKGDLMAEKSQAGQLLQVGIVAAFATLAFVGTTLIRIPIPATGGYFNLGDTFVMAAALLYGPWVGALVGLIGPALADAVGFPQFIVATAVVKFIEGGVVGLIAARRGLTAIAAALACGVAVLVIGYYIFEAAVYPWLAGFIPFFGVTDPKAALAEIVPNLLQGVLSALIAFGINRVFHHRQG